VLVGVADVDVWLVVELTFVVPLVPFVGEAPPAPIVPCKMLTLVEVDEDVDGVDSMEPLTSAKVVARIATDPLILLVVL